MRNFHNFLPPSPLRSPRVFEAGAGCRTARIAKHKQPRSRNGVWSPLRALQYAGPVDKAKLLLSLLPSPRPSSPSSITAFSFIRGGWKWCIIRNMKFFRDVVIQRKKKNYYSTFKVISIIKQGFFFVKNIIRLCCNEL